MSTMQVEPTTGPCEAWCSPEDVLACCAGEITSDTAVLEDSCMAATELLYALSGRQFTGDCTQTVRPCVDGCGCWPYNVMPGLSYGAPQYPVGAGGWGPWGFWGSGWGWGADSCGCTPISRALLPGYPVTAITEVKIDGDVISSDEYRLDGFRWLTRLYSPDGERQWWPGCQNLGLPDTEVGQAAAQLACDIYNSCSGGE